MATITDDGVVFSDTSGSWTVKKMQCWIIDRVGGRGQKFLKIFGAVYLINLKGGSRLESPETKSLYKLLLRRS